MGYYLAINHGGGKNVYHHSTLHWHDRPWRVLTLDKLLQTYLNVYISTNLLTSLGGEVL